MQYNAKSHNNIYNTQLHNAVSKHGQREGHKKVSKQG